jgi:hypothetical protein
VIRDQAAYERFRVEDDDRVLQDLDDDEAIAIAEALLTSSILALALSDRERAPPPLNLVRSLGIEPCRQSHQTHGVVKRTPPPAFNAFCREASTF